MLRAKYPSYPIPNNAIEGAEREREREREEMRIADVLRERDEGDDDISCVNSLRPSFWNKSYYASPTAGPGAGSSSRSLLSRWFRNRRKRFPADSGGERVIQRSAADGIVTAGVDSGGRLPEINLPSGIKPNEIAFNLGMGIGMAFLLAGNTNEMNKMVELREQMEMLLKEIKGEVQKRDDTSSLYTLSDAGGDEISTTISAQQNNSSSFDMEEPINFTESNRKNYQPVDKLRGMDQLEAELQVEIQRMELNFEGGDAGKHKMELKSKNVDLSSGSSAPAWYDHMDDENSEEGHGICAYDLERRLHELLQTRQQERIEALESALELAQRKLGEKEDELSCWKNIGGVITENEENYFSLSIK